MKAHDYFIETSDKKILNQFGITKDRFLSLPYGYQKMLIYEYWKILSRQDNNVVRNERLGDINENVKNKVLSLLKRK